MTEAKNRLALLTKMSDMMEEHIHFGKIAFEKARRYADRTVFKYRNDASGLWCSVSWSEFADQVRCIAKSLIELGIEEEDRVAIFSQNMVEIVAVDLACQAIRATTVPMYATASASQIDYIINDAGISTIFVGEQYQYDRTRAITGRNVLVGERIASPTVCSEPGSLSVSLNLPQ